MNYKGYTGSIHYSDEDGVFWGHVLGIRGIISYEGGTIPELFVDFKNGVDDYIDLCETHGWALDKPKISGEVIHNQESHALHYMDHTGSIEYSEEERVYHGRLTDIMGICEYSGTDLEHLKKDFKKAVDDYNGMMDSLYFDLLSPGFPAIHKLLVGWFEGQTCALDPEHPFVFRDAIKTRELLEKEEGAV